MKLHLLLDHTALLEDDEKETITTQPECSGVLEIEGRPTRVPVTGAPFVPDKTLVGHVRVLFTTDKGVVYKGIRPYAENGIPVSKPDYTKDYKIVRLQLDTLQRELERLTAEMHELSAACRHDALGFILEHNTKHTEV